MSSPELAEPATDDATDDTATSSTGQADDDFDIYCDVLGAASESAPNSDDVKRLADENEKLKAVFEKLYGEKRAVTEQNKILLKNISILYKTAKSEVDRKDKLIAEYRKKYDDMVFRRGGQPNTTAATAGPEPTDEPVAIPPLLPSLLPSVAMKRSRSPSARPKKRRRKERPRVWAPMSPIRTAAQPIGEVLTEPESKRRSVVEPTKDRSVAARSSPVESKLRVKDEPSSKRSDSPPRDRGSKKSAVKSSRRSRSTDKPKSPRRKDREVTVNSEPIELEVAGVKPSSKELAATVKLEQPQPVIKQKPLDQTLPQARAPSPVDWVEPPPAPPTSEPIVAEPPTQVKLEPPADVVPSDAVIECLLAFQTETTDLDAEMAEDGELPPMETSRPDAPATSSDKENTKSDRKSSKPSSKRSDRSPRKDSHRRRSRTPEKRRKVSPAKRDRRRGSSPSARNGGSRRDRDREGGLTGLEREREKLLRELRKMKK